MVSLGPCPHFGDASLLSADLDKIKGGECCGWGGPLSLCLHCSALLCPRHRISHVRSHPQHYLQITLQSLVIWCFKCNTWPNHFDVLNRQFPPGVVGLQNLGNTCYMNAVLQSLSAAPPLVAYFLSSPVPPGQGRLPMTSAIHKFFWDIWGPNQTSSIQPTQILYTIRNSHPLFRGFHQHDAQEFMRCLMDELHEEMKTSRVRDKSPPPPNDRDQDPCDSDGEDYETCDSGVSERSSLSDDTTNLRSSRSPSPEHMRIRSNQGGVPTVIKKQTKYRSIISDVFDGKLLSSVQCLTCNRISTRVETFQDLSLPIPSRDHIQMLHQGSNPSKASVQNNQVGWFWRLWEWVVSLFWGPPVSLHDCLAAFFSADELKGDNMYSCDKCKKLRNGIKYSRVVEAPEMLCIHLKRMRHDVMFSTKITNHVTFPLEGLDITPFLHNEVGVVYNLVSVICHYGQGPGCGHYTCFALSPNDGWYHYDDRSVTKVSPDVVKSSPAYVLFYRKDTSEIDRIRVRCQRIEETSSHESTVLIAKEWFTRFMSMSDPGVIDNSGLVCCHGNLSLEEHYRIAPQTWEYLHSVFGGGLMIKEGEFQFCPQCDQPQLTILPLQLNQFLRGGEETETYRVSSSWLMRWKEYTRGLTQVPPGPIDNTAIVSIENPDEDYIELMPSQWNMLVSVYGGGPAVHVKDNSDSDSRSTEEVPSSTDNVDSGCWFPFQNISENTSDSAPDEASQHELTEVTSTNPLTIVSPS